MMHLATATILFLETQVFNRLMLIKCNLHLNTALILNVSYRTIICNFMHEQIMYFPSLIATKIS